MYNVQSIRTSVYLFPLQVFIALKLEVCFCGLGNGRNRIDRQSNIAVSRTFIVRKRLIYKRRNVRIENE